MFSPFSPLRRPAVRDSKTRMKDFVRNSSDFMIGAEMNSSDYAIVSQAFCY